MRILVVEDDPLLGDGLKAGLAQAGFAVDWVKDGIAGEVSLKTTSHAAVVLDLGLPRLAGRVLYAIEDLETWAKARACEMTSDPNYGAR